MSNTNNLASYIWTIADLLRGDFRQSQYGRVILPFTLLRRLECVLENSKDSVLEQAKKLKDSELPEDAKEKYLLRATGGLSFYNTSELDLSKLGESDISANIESYIQSFSTDAREIFEHFKFLEFITQLNDANLLYKIVQKVKTTDLHPEVVTNHEMGLVFEELIRKFAESSNDTAGEHFTPRDIVRLTTSLVFMEDDEALSTEGIIKTIYDPTAGTGGFLSSGIEYVLQMNPNSKMVAFGQELNPESYAICKADMLIKGQEVSNIKLGNTLSNDQLYSNKFDYMLSNPPFGVDWKKIESNIKDENKLKGFNGRFGPGLPRVSDGSLLFLMHLISKFRGKNEGGGRIGIILNGSPLFTGGAGSGESEIRRYILENDLLETIVALPTDMFYNTGISTYVWILSNKKTNDKKGKVQLINGVNLSSKMRKSLGSKRNVMDEKDIALITKTFGDYQTVETINLDKPLDEKSNRGRQSERSKKAEPKTFAAKIFNYYDFGYRRITIERPLRESYQFSNEKIEELKFANKPLNFPMKWIHTTYKEDYTTYKTHEPEIRKHLKENFPDIKEGKIKDLLDSKLWETQLNYYNKAKELQKIITTEQFNDKNKYDQKLKDTKIDLDAKEKKAITDAVTWKNPDAEKVIKKIHKNTKTNPLYGLFKEDNQIVEYKQDGDLRDNENVALNPDQTVDKLNEDYFKKEVLPHVPEAWINNTKTDSQDNQIGVVGYEIPFNRHFYIYTPPRPLEVIDKELDTLSKEIMDLLQEVHS